MKEASTEKKESKIQAFITVFIESFKKIFKIYPFTMGAIIIATILGCIIIDRKFYEVNFIIHTISFLAIFSAGSIFSEEYFKNARIQRFSGYAVSAIVSFALVAILFSKSDSEPNLLNMYSPRILVCYITGLLLSTIYKMYKSSQSDFNKYCLNVFCQLVKSTVIYGLFAIGIALVVLIFNILILDSDQFSLLGRLELFLAGTIYTPMIINDFSVIKENAGKFAKIVFEFTLFPLLLAAFAIIYIYIIKIIVTHSYPSNQIFPILSLLFIIGLPIWTLTMNYKDQALGKLAFKIPYIFAPLVIPEIIVLAMRISEYGITNTRYLGIMIIIFQIIYIVLFAVKSGKYIEYITFAAIALITATLLVPGINIFSSSVRSQGRRLLEMTDNEKIDTDLKLQADAKKLYRYIMNECNIEGFNFINGNYSEEEQKTFEEWDVYYNEQSSSVYSYYSWSYPYDEVIDVTGFSSFKETTLYSDNGTFEINISGDTINYDFSELVNLISSDEYYFDTNDSLIQLNESTYLFIDYYNLQLINGELDSFYVVGYIMNKSSRRR